MTKQPIILVIDDEDRNLRLMEALIIPFGYHVLLANDGTHGLDLAMKTQPDLILLDIMMPGMNGYEVSEKLKADQKTHHIPIVMITALKEVEDRVKALEAGADDFLTKPVDKSELKARIQSLLKVKAYNDYMQNYQKELEIAVKKRTQDLQKAIHQKELSSTETILRLSRAAEYKDDDTGAHVIRMSRYAGVIARQIGLSEKSVKVLIQAAPMHDIGKIGIPDSILLKPGKLDAEEWKLMKEHAYFGKKILEGSSAPIIQVAETVAYTHHEKFDGSGYPNGLSGTTIPISGRIVALADVFDALTSKRPYKEAFSIEKSFRIIREGNGTHFDPLVVDAFFQKEKEILAIKETYKDKGESKLFALNRLKSDAEQKETEPEFVVWNDDYSVGIENIDSQHKQILSILNDMYKKKYYDSDMKTKISELIEYTNNHLQLEEDLMEKYQFPDIATHKEMHEKLKQKTHELEWKVKSNDQTISTELFNFLKDWWINHILFVDQEYIPFIH